ncbi:hypothetical protein CRG98_045193 [Punica granatum]|uniref:Uncharacterized protein n=1 Tax=Punica granatum TaxID=22663 RepID=A0A2I0HRT5_PUNGR|nr:hypothetical protein CRG98_045193 [Punica granatum]
MAATSDREMELLLSSFDQIYQDFKSGMEEIQLLKSNCQAETKRREALEIACHSVKQGFSGTQESYPLSGKQVGAGALLFQFKMKSYRVFSAEIVWPLQLLISNRELLEEKDTLLTGKSREEAASTHNFEGKEEVSG